MHVSERLLQLYAELDASTRNVLQESIKQNLGDGKPLSVSYEELTGKSLDGLTDDVKSANDFSAWIKDGKKDATFLLYYVALLENGGVTEKKAAPKTEDTPPVASAPVEEEPIAPAQREPLAKQRYMPEAPVPSRAERAKYQRSIEPARPRKKKGKWVAGLFLIALLLGGGYIGYPYVSALFEPSEKAEVETPAPEPEQVAETPAVTEVWLTEKNVSLLSEPNSDNVTYIGDIGDRYNVLEERDDHVLLDLGVDGMTAWAPTASTTTEWGTSTVSDEQVLAWIETGVDPTFVKTTVEEYLTFSEEELYTALGQPYGRDEDALNDYVFYSGIFFVIQDEAVHAIDWTNTGTTKEEFKRLGTPTIETEDAIVYESPTYSIRMFIGTNGTARIRITEI